MASFITFVLSLVRLSFLSYVLLGRSYLTVNLNDSTSTPKPTPSGCFTIDYTIFPLPFWHTASSSNSSRLIRRRHCPSLSFLASWHCIPQTQSRCNYLTQYFTTWELRLNTHKTKTILFSKGHLQSRDTFVPWASAARYLGLVLHSKLLYTQHLHTVANKATAVLCNIPPPEIQHSHSPNWPSANYSFDPSHLTPPLSAVPHVPATTSNSQLSSQSVFESSVIIPDAPHFPLARHSKPSAHPSYHPPNYSQIFAQCPSHPNPLVQQIGNCTPADLTAMH